MTWNSSDPDAGVGVVQLLMLVALLLVAGSAGAQQWQNVGADEDGVRLNYDRASVRSLPSGVRMVRIAYEMSERHYNERFGHERELAGRYRDLAEYTGVLRLDCPRGRLLTENLRLATAGGAPMWELAMQEPDSAGPKLHLLSICGRNGQCSTQGPTNGLGWVPVMDGSPFALLATLVCGG